MMAGFFNVYDDNARADAYAKLEFPGTYYLAFRDVPTILSTHIQGRNAVDFGCGTGRSTRLLRTLGYDVVGVDISAQMLAQARARDPDGDYRLVPDGDLGGLTPNSYDLVFSAFTFDNVPTMERSSLFGLWDGCSSAMGASSTSCRPQTSTATNGPPFRPGPSPRTAPPAVVTGC